MMTQAELDANNIIDSKVHEYLYLTGISSVSINGRDFEVKSNQMGEAGRLRWRIDRDMKAQVKL